MITLDERIARELKERYLQLESKGAILSQEQLARYFSTFRARFGPDKLMSLGDEALLDTVYSFGRDSLVYWLEFKNDDEFPSINFGSIAGGSAFKYGLFPRKETGVWTTGSPQHPVSLSQEQAIDLARRHRSQLIKGAELLERLPEHATEADYAALQQDMDTVAQDISNLSWVHKYFHLLYPQKLDDFHNPDYQRFHLFRLLQLPPEGRGRYYLAGYFVDIAEQLTLPMTSLTATLNERNGPPYGWWRIGTTSGPDGKDCWEMMREQNCVAIGWLEQDDLSAITNNRDGKEAVRQLLLSRHPSMSHQAAGRVAQQLLYFRWNIVPNDLVLASNGATVLGVGRVTGNYFFNPSSGGFSHRRPVQWLSLDPWQQPDVEGNQTTAYRMRREKNLLAAEKRIYEHPIPVPSPAPEPGEPSQPPRLPPLPPLPAIAERIRAILGRKGQVILYGPPGTGKTYWAEYTARELAARTNFGKTHEQLTDEQKACILGTDEQSNGTVRMCTFHPAYGYEDFLEGFRPAAINDQMHFMLRDGIFKKLCDDAQRRPNERFFLIIDEINRGDIPRIFGELLTILEKNKRGKAILLPLTGNPFRVPDNVYVIGTMNTADRSIALLDTALRRRFGFIELMPDIDTLGDVVLSGIPLGPWLSALNERICLHAGRDARNLQIGHSYLLEQGRPIGDFATFAKILQEDILPLLQEYCYDDYTALANILGTGFIDSQKQQIREELFHPANRDKLTLALLEPTSDIMASWLALQSEMQAQQEQDEESKQDAENGDGWHDTDSR